MTKYIIDTYAWVEYFLGSFKGEVVHKLFLKKEHVFYTVDCCLAELQGWALREGQDFSMLLKVIRANSTIISMAEEDWIHTGEERFRRRKEQSTFGLIDATLLVQQRKLDGKIVSGDPHFSGLKNVVFLH